MTIAIVERTPEDARRHLTRIRLTAGIVRDNLPRLHALIQEAKLHGDDRVLGYASWTAYVSDAFSDEPMRLPREERQELVAMLAGEGMSTRAIAPIVGAHHDTVAEDIKAVVGNPTPEVSVPEPTEPSAADFPTVDPDTGEILEAGDEPTPQVDEAPTVRTVTGLDGKNYTSSGPTERRRPFLADVQKAGWELRKAIERLERLETDDRFTKNKAENWGALQPHLDLAAETLTRLRDRLT